MLVPLSYFIVTQGVEMFAGESLTIDPFNQPLSLKFELNLDYSRQLFLGTPFLHIKD